MTTILPNAKLEFSESPMGSMSSSLLCVCPTRKQKNWGCCCMPRVWSQPSHWVSRSTGFKICHPELWLLAPHRMISSLVLQSTHFHPVLTRLYTSHISKEPCTHLHLHNYTRKKKLSLNSVKYQFSYMLVHFFLTKLLYLLNSSRTVKKTNKKINTPSIPCPLY